MWNIRFEDSNYLPLKVHIFFLKKMPKMYYVIEPLNSITKKKFKCIKISNTKSSKCILYMLPHLLYSIPTGAQKRREPNLF